MQSVECLVCGSSARESVITLRPDAHRRVHAHTARTPVRFVVCRDCGLLYQTPRYTLDELRPIYADEYRKETVDANGVPNEAYLEFARTKSRAEFTWITKRLGGMRPGRVLEAGCATGQLLRYFKDGGWDAVGLEPTRVFAEYGARVHGIQILPVLFEEAELTSTFDLIILSQVLEHVLDPGAVLTRAARLLSPGGRLYISVPYFETYLPVRPARELFISTHLYAFSPASLRNVARGSALSAEAVGTMTRYLCALFAPGIPSPLERDDPTVIRRRVRRLTLRYFIRHDSWYLTAEWVKRRLVAALGNDTGARTVERLRRIKHRLVPRVSA